MNNYSQLIQILGLTECHNDEVDDTLLFKYVEIIKKINPKIKVYL
jgi:hypothetical protein